MKRKGSGVKPKATVDAKKVIYSKEHWELLTALRQQARELMELLQRENISSLVYGSVCRGDVNKTSDIDVFIPYQVSSFLIELAVEKAGYNIYGKKIVQATPKHVVKGEIMLKEDISIIFPLTSLREREFDFIRFGGSLSLEELQKNKRVPGVDKRLVLIEPIEKGHWESQVLGFESLVARKVGVDVELVKERVRILTTRDKKGRTGVYLKRKLGCDESIEAVFKELKDSDPIVRRRANN